MRVFKLYLNLSEKRVVCQELQKTLWMAYGPDGARGLY